MGARGPWSGVSVIDRENYRVRLCGMEMAAGEDDGGSHLAAMAAARPLVGPVPGDQLPGALLHRRRLRPSSQTVGMRTHRPRLAPATRSAFAGFRFPPDVIVLAVRWYLRFGLSYRDVEELLAEREVEVDHVTVYRWVQRFTPLLAEAARPAVIVLEIAGP
jgi:hypothetical protein